MLSCCVILSFLQVSAVVDALLLEYVALTHNAAGAAGVKVALRA
jgi:hypothetical protein